MLFEKVPGLYGSGVVPSRFEEFKEGIRSLIMTQFFTEDGTHVGVTVVSAGPCVVTQVRTEENDGYDADYVYNYSKRNVIPSGVIWVQIRDQNAHADFRGAIRSTQRHQNSARQAAKAMA